METHATTNSQPPSLGPTRTAQSQPTNHLYAVTYQQPTNTVTTLKSPTNNTQRLPNDPTHVARQQTTLINSSTPTRTARHPISTQPITATPRQPIQPPTQTARHSPATAPTPAKHQPSPPAVTARQTPQRTHKIHPEQHDINQQRYLQLPPHGNRPNHQHEQHVTHRQ